MKGGNLDNVTIFKITPRVIPDGLLSNIEGQTVGYVNTNQFGGGCGNCKKKADNLTVNSKNKSGKCKKKGVDSTVNSKNKSDKCKK